MRQPTTRSDASLVDEQIGTSYDVVKKVHDNLDIIEDAANVSDDVMVVVDNIDSVNAVSGSIAGVNTVAGISTDVTTVATNIADVQAAPQAALDAVAARDAALAAQGVVQTAEANVVTLEGEAETHKDAAEDAATRAEAAAQTASSALTVRGDWDASNGLFPTPTLSPERADFYHISVAGTMRNPSAPNQQDIEAKVGDELYWNIDSDVWYLIGQQVDSIDRVASAARTEADMYAMIAENQDKYAASSFVHYGWHSNSTQPSLAPINEGLFVGTNIASRLLMGHVEGNDAGESKIPFPRTHIAGFISDLYAFNHAPSAGHINTIKFPEAPDGTVTYDSATGEVVQHDSAIEAFEGLSTNGDFRNYTGSVPDGFSVYTGTVLNKVDGKPQITRNIANAGIKKVITTEVGKEYTIRINVVDADAVFYGRVVGISGSTFDLPLSGNIESTFTATSTSHQIDIYTGTDSVGLQYATIGSLFIAPSTEEVVTDRVDMFGAEFFLEEFDAYNPYVYPKGMIQSKATTMNGITTTSTDKPSTYYHVFPRPSGGNIWTVGSAVADGSLDSQFATVLGDDPAKLEEGKTYEVSYDYQVTSGSLQLIVGNTGTVQNVGSGSYSDTMVVTSGSFFRVRQTTSNSVGFISNIQVREVSVEDDGLGVNFFEATQEQQLAMVGDPTNNIFRMNDGRWVQWRMRQRTVAGAGNGDWSNTDSINVGGLGFASNVQVAAQGSKNSTTDFVDVAHYVEYYSDVAAHKNNVGVFVQRSSISDVSIGQLCFFHVWGTVPRLNQGAYHPSFNESGARQWRRNGYTAGVPWHNSEIGNVTKKDAFTDSTAVAVGQRGYEAGTGFIGGTASGRTNDGHFYDAIYAEGWGGVSDDRLSAFDMSSPEEAAKIDTKVKNGTYRGKERLVRTQIEEFFDYHNTVGSATFTKTGSAVTDVSSGYGWYGYRLRFDISTPENTTSGFNSSINAFDGDNINSYAVYVGDNGNTFVARGVNHFAFNGSQHYFVPVGGFNESGTERDAFNAAFPNGTIITVYVVHADYAGEVANPTAYSVEGDFSCIDVLGNPSEILSTPQLANGWVGYWIPVIPDPGTTPESFPLTRKALMADGTIIQGVSTSDNGVTWSQSLPALTSTTNTFALDSHGIPTRVGVYSYTAAAYVTEKDENRPVFGAHSGQGEVFVQSEYLLAWGSLFTESLLHKVPTNTSWYSGQTIPLIDKFIDYRDVVMTDNHRPTHAPLNTAAPSNESIAIKALNYQTTENGKAYLNYSYEELAYTSGAFNPWGDDRTMSIVDGGVNGTDTNGVSVRQGTNRLVKPYGYTKNQARAGTQTPDVDL